MTAYTPTLFDQEYDRRNLNSLKWSQIPSHALALWLADMDFKCPLPVQEGLKKHIESGFLGYPALEDAYFEAVATWFHEYHNFRNTDQYILPVTGIMPALASIIDAFAKAGDGVIMQPPAYYRFAEIIEASGRVCLNNPLMVDQTNAYFIDFEGLEQLKRHSPKVFLLCSPHNPVGKVWSKEELIQIGDYCIENNILLVVDEIHCDLIMPHQQFTSFGSLPDKYLKNTILLNSSTKSFNLAGLRGGNVFVFQDNVYQKLMKVFKKWGIDKVNTMFLIATRIAYTQCRGWLVDLNQYLDQNRKHVEHFIDEHMPVIRFHKHEATYLMWLNYQALNITENQISALLDKDLVLSKGSVFGANGNGYLRINIACPRSVLERALHILKNKIRDIYQSDALMMH